LPTAWVVSSRSCIRAAGAVVMLWASFLALALNNFIQREQWNSPNLSS
jgi:hypothetical protein